MLRTDGENKTSDTGIETFPFLRLPPEVREMIYHHHLTSERIAPRYAALTKRWTPIDLVYVSRTIYSEAVFHLYTKGEFVLAVRPESVFCLATCPGKADLEIFAKSQKTMDLIRHIALEIHWPSVEYSKLVDRGCSRDDFKTDTMFKQTIATVGAILAGLPMLRTIDVSWFQMTVHELPLIEAAPPRYKIPIWLRGLKQVRRKNEKVLIRMPLKGPISTEELAWDQEDRGEIVNLLMEMKEDVQELQGIWTEGPY